MRLPAPSVGAGNFPAIRRQSADNPGLPDSVGHVIAQLVERVAQPDSLVGGCRRTELALTQPPALDGRSRGEYRGRERLFSSYVVSTLGSAPLPPGLPEVIDLDASLRFKDALLFEEAA